MGFHVDGAERHDALGRGQDARRPGQRLEAAAVMVVNAAVALPAAERQQEIEPRRIRHLRGGEVLFPRAFPPLRHPRRRQTAGTVHAEQPEFQGMSVEVAHEILPLGKFRGRN
jgi:hypothetical protein